MLKLYLKFAFYRTLSVAVIQTYFVPDEYWQSLEPAHLHSFGYGFKTWEFREGIRSYAYPALFYLFYKLLSFLRLDSVICIVYGPRLIQALLAAAADSLFFTWCKSFQFLPAWVALVITTDWFGFYCSSRTIINTLETNLVSFGLYFFPLSDLGLPGILRQGHLKTFIVLVCSSCFIRPTAVAIWGPFCLFWVVSSPIPRRKSIVYHFIIIGVLTSCILIMVDSYFYSAFVITPWRFLKFNLFYGVSTFYGTHPFHWYYLQGIPVVLGVLTFPFVVGINAILKDLFRGDGRPQVFRNVNLAFCFTISIAILLYSFIPHKEFRFILPLSPLMQFIALQSLNAIGSRKIQKIFAASSVSTFVALILFFGLVHQRGTLSAMKQLAADAEQRPNQTSILILTPCHATPLYSHLHVDVPVRFIQCEPPIKVGQRDESDDFFSDPLTWLQLYWEINPLPTHIVMFDSLAIRLSDYVLDKFFIEHEAFFHTAFPDPRTGNFVIIYRHRDWNM